VLGSVVGTWAAQEKKARNRRLHTYWHSIQSPIKWLFGSWESQSTSWAYRTVVDVVVVCLAAVAQKLVVVWVLGVTINFVAGSAVVFPALACRDGIVATFRVLWEIVMAVRAVEFSILRESALSMHVAIWRSPAALKPTTLKPTVDFLFYTFAAVLCCIRSAI
jgi:hypothetical protein